MLLIKLIFMKEFGEAPEKVTRGEREKEGWGGVNPVTHPPTPLGRQHERREGKGRKGKGAEGRAGRDVPDASSPAVAAHGLQRLDCGPCGWAKAALLSVYFSSR